MSKLNWWQRGLVGLLVLLLLVLINWWVFREWLGLDYFQWYLDKGAVIGLGAAAVSMVWGKMREHTGLISANPLDYIGSYMQLVGLPFLVLGTHLVSGPDWRKAYLRTGKFITLIPKLWDNLIAALLVLFMGGVLLLWLLVVAPQQYFIFLICGAPARFFSDTQRRVVARLEGTQLKTQELPRREETPKGWWDASIADKPVTVTNLFASLLITLITSWLL